MQQGQVKQNDCWDFNGDFCRQEKLGIELGVLDKADGYQDILISLSLWRLFLAGANLISWIVSI